MSIYHDKTQQILPESFSQSDTFVAALKRLCQTSHFSKCNMFSSFLKMQIKNEFGEKITKLWIIP